MRRNKLLAGLRLALSVVLGSQVAAGHAKTASGEQVREEMAAGPATGAASTAALPWWAGFNEPTLTRLQDAARAHAAQASVADAPSPLDAQVAAAYIAARILNVRVGLARELVDSLAAQSRLLAGAAPTPANAELLAGVAARRAGAERFASALVGQRDAAMAALARWCGLSDGAMASLMAPAIALRDLPLFDAAPPSRLPRALLRARADVSAAESRLLLGRKSTGSALPWIPGGGALSGWIGLEPDAPLAPAAAPPDASELVQVATQAETEVRARLRALQQHTEEAARRLEIVRIRRAELDAARRRVQLGAGSPDEVAQDYQRLLVDNDQLAIAGGELAYSWIALQLSTAGFALQHKAEMPRTDDAALPAGRR